MPRRRLDWSSSLSMSRHACSLGHQLLNFQPRWSALVIEESKIMHHIWFSHKPKGNFIDLGACWFPGHINYYSNTVVSVSGVQCIDKWWVIIPIRCFLHTKHTYHNGNMVKLAGRTRLMRDLAQKVGPAREAQRQVLHRRVDPVGAGPSQDFWTSCRSVTFCACFFSGSRPFVQL